MKQLSFLEKLGILGQNILAHPVFICILLIPVILIFLNQKIRKKAIVLIYIAVLAVVLFIGNTTIFALFDNVVDGLFMSLYFPNFITLFIVEVASAIITLITFIKPNIVKSKKIINIVSFAIIQTIFCLILTVVQVNDINIYEENALYGNDDVLTLMQLFMGMFFLQTVTLLVIFSIDKVTARLDAKEKGETKHENHITHAKIEPIVKVITEEPEVTLPKSKPVKPLNKKYIEKSHIKPIDLNEIITDEKMQKEQLKPTSSKLPKVQAEVLYIPKSETTKPPVIKTEPSEIKQLLKPEVIDIKTTPTIPAPEVEVLDINKKEDEQPKEIKQPQAKWVPQPKPEQNQQKTPETTPELFTFKDFKPEFPNAETKTTSMSPTIKTDSIFPVGNKEETTTQKIPVPKVKPKQFVNYDIVGKQQENIITEKEVLPNIKQTTPPQPKIETKQTKTDELIVNLVIVNFEKTVSAVKNLNTVYTM